MEEKYEQNAELLKVLAHPVRLGLINFLLQAGPSNVTQLQGEFDMPQSTISQHLGKLRHARILRGNRKGLEIYYEIIDPRIEQLVRVLK
ncbi:ArsR/SmtB family transcription factor [Ectobacillus antri]|uniref:ArsR/SmtB family transcription factor n=1 Tax=Ectobacillus antri TaxID=2486280 RepID=UPI000F5A69BB|nr:metalloregulator ArsR/SmtB family transcription factor [Ectobacillus antri]